MIEKQFGTEYGAALQRGDKTACIVSLQAEIDRLSVSGSVKVSRWRNNVAHIDGKRVDPNKPWNPAVPDAPASGPPTPGGSLSP